MSTLSDSSVPAANAGHSDLITSAIINPTNAFQLITGSLSGHIKIWDFVDAALLQTISLGGPIFHICAHEKFPDYLFVAGTKAGKKQNGQFPFYNFL